MALPVLDGNQTATTLSSVVTGGEHIVAHSVVSLGANAIANITSAVSGSVVSISNFPSTQTIAGTVTANLNYDNFSGALTSYVEAVSSHNAFPVEIAYQPSVTIGSLPAISGTVTAHLADLTGNIIPLDFSALDNDGIPNRGVQIGWANTNDGAFYQVSDVNPLPISGTVTVANQQTLISYSGMITATASPVILARGEYSSTGWTTLEGVFTDLRDNGVGVPIGLPSGVTSLGVNVGNSVTIGSLPAISGTVTANVSNGSLTTRFGTPTTANTAFATSAVTNANRKYLLIQNVTTGSNVITVGIGFTPTTTQGIQLTAGAGITFESSYIPTGAVYVLSSVTASNFTILEA